MLRFINLLVFYFAVMLLAYHYIGNYMFKLSRSKEHNQLHDFPEDIIRFTAFMMANVLSTIVTLIVLSINLAL